LLEREQGFAILAVVRPCVSSPSLQLPVPRPPQNTNQAAAVANRLDVATLLLQEAGSFARPLALATNRYGQSAWQIAARKGCSEMMQLLATAAA